METITPLQAYATPTVHHGGQGDVFWRDHVSDSDYRAWERIIAAAERYAKSQIDPATVAAVCDEEDREENLPALVAWTRMVFARELVVDYVGVMLS